MTNRIDEAIAAYAHNRSDDAYRFVQITFLEEDLYVPVTQPVKELQPGRHDVPVSCVRTEAGAGAIPAFTALEHLHIWEPRGCLYTTLTGRSLLEMAVGMAAISEILINPNDVPRGRIPRSDFQKMLALKSQSTNSVRDLRDIFREPNEMYAIGEDLCDQKYTEGRKLIWPYLRLAGRPAEILEDEGRRSVVSGIALLEDVLTLRPDNQQNWATHWVLGKAYQLLEDYERSYQHFKSSFVLNADHPDVARELMAACIAVGRTEEAVLAAQVALRMSPNDLGLKANLALALSRNGNRKRALQICDEVQAIDPSEPLVGRVRKWIFEGE